MYVGNTSNVTTPCLTSQPQLYNLSDPNVKQSNYDLVIFPNNAGNDPNGISFGASYQATPLAVSCKNKIWVGRGGSGVVANERQH